MIHKKILKKIAKQKFRKKCLKVLLRKSLKAFYRRYLKRPFVPTEILVLPRPKLMDKFGQRDSALDRA